MSFPRAGQICAAAILAELGPPIGPSGRRRTGFDRPRYLTADQLAADAGLCPVTCQSGKSRGVGFRRACNRRLRAALTCFADNSRHASAWAARVHADARARGCTHPHAIRILGRAWTRVLWRAWQDRTPYHPAKHPAAVAIG
jgi:transposase